MDIKLETIDHGLVLVKTESNGDYFMHIGDSEPQFLGNADEGVYSEIAGVLNINTERQGENMKKIFAKIVLLKHAQGSA
ncbi:MAG: hypothetical protein A3B13_01475 [Candidatus Liptonbacteria bacterium RIFCSPLOWO2_01_FULL_45_15]|uniref:Uncharacterized protein n=1 Tax=Candidatus Liptonbacteria bacterium RIFCSPLOWO2_01_FULL_45_15 TaxID=1798649 RepID=A0A1G2CCI0_9BACT|nr:MAG: hypothetical protein A3B13_01475 [Candidatus Liptonbacteria bacterium RIFCSPLOWO2_01_FULL_45_15]